MEIAIQPQRIWCTLVMLNDNYACGAAIVAQSLRTVQTKYPIWCMVTNDVSIDCREWLSKHVDKVIIVPVISYPVVSMKSKKQNAIYGSWIHASFTKWNILNPDLFPVEKVILLDADMLFVENCDELFDLPAPALTFSSPWARPYMTNRFGVFNPYGEMKHGQIVDKNNIRRGFHSGILGLACMVLVKPSRKATDIMYTILHREEVYGNSECVSGFDEQLIAETLLALDDPIHHIHQSYNWIIGKTNWLLHKERPKSYQWYNGKPWNQERNSWPDLLVWWSAADQLLVRDPDAKKWFELEKINIS